MSKFTVNGYTFNDEVKPTFSNSNFMWTFGKPVITNYSTMSQQAKNELEAWEIATKMKAEEERVAKEEEIQRKELLRYYGLILDKQIKVGEVQLKTIEAYLENFGGTNEQRQTEVLRLIYKQMVAPVVGLERGSLGAFSLVGKEYTVADLQMFKNWLMKRFGDCELDGYGWLIDLMSASFSGNVPSFLAIVREANQPIELEMSKLLSETVSYLGLADLFGGDS